MRHLWAWLVIVFPAAMGIVLVILLNVGGLPDPILHIRIDVGTLAFLVGLALSGALGIRWFRRWKDRQNRAKLQSEAAEERRSFIRRLDHELKNPLMAMLAGIANLNSTSLNSGQGEIITSLEAQVGRVNRLVSNLRKLAELEVRPIDQAPINIDSLLQEAVSIIQERSEPIDRHLSLTLPQAPWPLPTISGDYDLLFLLAYNLLDNALKFTQPGDRVEVRAYEDGTHVVIEVADTGPGISEDDAPLVWEELFRSKSARGVPGSGMGLALVRAIALRHRGQVTLRSRSGQGSVFTVRLPVTDF